MKEALKLALEALEYWDVHGGLNQPTEEAITAIKAALAQPAQEPVAWMVYTLDGTSVCVTDNPADFTPEHRALPLYTTPPQRKPLTDEQLKPHYQNQEWLDGVRFAEAAHGIKE